MWVRGLKLREAMDFLQTQLVAPYVGAWIETGSVVIGAAVALSHPMWMRGLKPIRLVRHYAAY